MVPCAFGKKSKASHCFDVISILTKDIIIFYWWMIVTEKLLKIYERIFSMEGSPTSPIEDNFKPPFSENNG